MRKHLLPVLALGSLTTLVVLLISIPLGASGGRRRRRLSRRRLDEGG
jgi:hypothetical protein